jgi:hypothetical protein
MISHCDGKKEAFYTAQRDGSELATAQELLQCLADVCTDTWRGGIGAGLHTLNFSLDRFSSEKNFRNFTAILYLNVSLDPNNECIYSSTAAAASEQEADRGDNESKSENDVNRVVEWDLSTEGGALRCYVGAEGTDCTGVTATEVRDVAPTGGRVVLFPSRDLLHAVRPTKRSRLALTAWIFSDAVLADDEISSNCVVES